MTEAEKTSGNRLKEHNGAMCKRCDKEYAIGMRKCPKCGSPLEERKWYTRLCVERIAFIPALMIVILALSFLSSDPELKALPLIVPAGYVLAHAFLGMRFRETFADGELPEYAHENFSFKRFLKEGTVFAVIVIVLGVGFAVVELLHYFKPDG